MQVHKIQAAVLRIKGVPLKIESLELEGPRDDEVLVRIVASGICHIDIDFCEAWDSADTPVVLGHEGAGVVEHVGKSVQSVSCGDHVVLSYQSCGHCRQCRSGHPTDCEFFYEANFGFDRLDGSGRAISYAITEALTSLTGARDGDSRNWNSYPHKDASGKEKCYCESMIQRPSAIDRTRLKYASQRRYHALSGAVLPSIGQSSLISQPSSKSSTSTA
jgi:hypothetical protein